MSVEKGPAPKRRPKSREETPKEGTAIVGSSVRLLQYELVATDSLRPDPRNARKHSRDQITKLAKLIRRFGFTTPLVVLADNSIVAGHGRLEAAKTLGLTEVPVLRAPDGWSEADVRAYILADNQIAIAAEWDEELLREELQLLQSADYDVGGLGFDQKELDRLLAAELAGPSEFPTFDENIETTHECPKCGYRWSGGVIAPEANE